MIIRSKKLLKLVVRFAKSSFLTKEELKEGTVSRTRFQPRG